MSENATSFKPSLGLLDATMLVAGSMIGSGIFIVSADISRNVGSVGWLVAVWVLTGIMTLTAAVSYGELSGMFPKAGGQYIYLKEAFNPLIGFLYGWSFFAVIQTATIAAVGVAFAKFTAYLIPAVSEDIVALDLGFIKFSRAQLLSIVVIVLLTAINTRGVKSGKLIQTTFTLTKLLSIFGLIFFGLLWAKPGIWEANWANAWDMKSMVSPGNWTELTTIAALGAVAAAMTGSIFSSDAWNNVTFIAGEIRNPQRNIGLSLFFGTLIVTAVYVTTNLMYTAVLPLDAIATATKDRVAVVAAQEIFGAAGTAIIAVMIMVSTFGCNNGLILAGARVYYTMAKDGLFFKQVGTLNSNAVPSVSLWIQCIAACLWSLSGTYGQLLDMISFVAVAFYMLTIAGIFVLRKKRPDLDRPYKAFGYPFFPIIYIVMGTVFCILLICYKPEYALYGLVITLLGIPLYYLAIGNKRKLS
jgi:APA family basic amino acid/polyamine antiporter